MAPANPSINGLQAFQILPLIAVNTMVQPTGRVLGVSAVHGVWLRASPIICALDALGTALRFLSYCAVLRATPREAMLIIGMDRFDEAEVEGSVRKTMIFTTTLRYFGFFLGVLPLAYMVGAWGDIRWTVAWAWMYAASYVVLEIASQLAKRELLERSKPQYTPLDFELHAVVEEQDDGEVSHADSAESIGDTEKDEVKPLKDEIQGEPADSASTKSKSGRDDKNDGSTTSPAEFMTSDTTETANEGGLSDPEVGKNSGNRGLDPVASPRLPGLKSSLSFMDVLLFRCGCLLQATFLYWAFLDLVQPTLNRYILSSSSWVIPLYFLSLPFVFAALGLTVAGSVATGSGIFMAFRELAAFVNSHLPASVHSWASTVVTVTFYGIGGVGMPVGYLAGSYFIGGWLLSEYMQWVYRLIPVEVLVLLVFFVASFCLYVLLGLVGTGVKQKIGVPGYLEKDRVALLTCVLVAFTVSILWYRFRYASSSHWAQDWRDSLAVNGTTTSSTATNTAMADSTTTS